jgi:hypothetical protein
VLERFNFLTLARADATQPQVIPGHHLRTSCANERKSVFGSGGTEAGGSTRQFGGELTKVCLPTDRPSMLSAPPLAARAVSATENQAVTLTGLVG